MKKCEDFQNPKIARYTSNEPTYLVELVENAVQVAEQNILGRVLSEVDQGGATVRLHPRVRLVVEDHQQAGNDFGVEIYFLEHDIINLYHYNKILVL